MPLFPMFVDLTEESVLIVGQGRHAADKAARLVPYCRNIRTVSLEEFREDLLTPAPALVVLAQTGDPRNAGIAARCAALRIPVNAVDDPELCSVRFPALVNRGELSVGIATGGRSPVAAGLIRQAIEHWLPSRTGEILAWSGELTRRLRREIPDYAQRTALLRELLRRAFRENRPIPDDEIHRSP